MMPSGSGLCQETRSVGLTINDDSILSIGIKGGATIRTRSTYPPRVKEEKSRRF